MEKRSLGELREKANMLPLLPGVYLMLDDAGGILYVGKAKALKNRVTSYFRGEHTPKVAAMVAHVADFHVIVAESEFEALVLENSLIKLHKPKYNIMLKDDSGYPFVRLDVGSTYPRFTLVRRTEKDGARYFGPYGSRSTTREILDTVCKALRLPTCTRKLPQEIGKTRPCLQYHMGACAGYCTPEASAEDYRRSIDEAILILEGRTDELAASLKKQMEDAAEALQFETAAALRDRLRALAELRNHQRVIATAYSDADAVGFERGAKTCFTVLHFTDGDLTGKDFTLMEEPTEPDAEAVASLVRQYYEPRSVWPRQILLPCEIEAPEALQQLLSEKAGHRVAVETPKRGERRRLTEAAVRNAHEEILRATTETQRGVKTLEWLQRALLLPELPLRIEAFDISNLSDTGIVAGMTVFERGRPRRRAYRKFRIREQTGQDDYSAMREAVRRRFRRYLDGDEKFAPLPELLLIDGGAEHAAAAAHVLEALGVSVPVFGMVKDDRHRTRALVSPEGREIGIAGNPAVFALVGTIQEETHRYAITYQRSLRSETLHSALDAIPGIGEKRRQALLQAFHTVRTVREASPEALHAVLPIDAAQAVYDYYHPEKRGTEPCE